MVSSELQLRQQESRAPDPNVLQRRAANPVDSVWVGASAGSGKTKVLTDRVLRLLLPDNKGNIGALPHKILALTFTKAAASEMVLRISKSLSAWATLSDDELITSLEKLLDTEPTAQQIEAAKRLFAQVVDVPGGLKIMTIHSFCQSMLGRFPLEAGLSPNFQIVEDTRGLLIVAHDKALKQAAQESGSPLTEAVYNISAQKNEEQFLDLLINICSERRQFKKILTRYSGVDGLYTNICQAFDISAGQSWDDVLREACRDSAFNEQGLRSCCQAMSLVKNKDAERSVRLQFWLDADVEKRIKNYDDYQNIFLTEGNIRKRIVTKPVIKEYELADDIMRAEAERIHALEQRKDAIKIAELTRDLFFLGQKILEEFQLLKQQKSALDFDDLIGYTLDLLSGVSMKMESNITTQWVRFKMDQGIDHILVDEAQDTNPEQWEIIQLLCDDFFDGEAAKDTNRTVFVVGDKKQSIFSFQRARPEKFDEMKQWFQDKIESSQKNFTPVDFITSFRSVPSILELVDTVFSTPEMLSGIGKEPLEHHSYRYKQAGHVELWPVFTSSEKEEIDPWAPPIEVIESQSGASQMAEYIGNRIRNWLDDKDSTIKAGDIMILLKSRTAFVDQLVRALKTRDVPVSGVDRMVLNKQLVVEDLCACASFALLPDDDLILAALLKSPFIGFDDDMLFTIAQGRKGTLWQSLKEHEHKDVIIWLQALIQQSGLLRPYEFFSRILQEKCPAHKKSGYHAIKKCLGDEALDPLDEFLNKALDFERDNIPSLQIFLQEQITGHVELKRQMEESGNAVRIMTVHGSKGLQAPIVILPDTMKANAGKLDQILWPERSGADLPFFCPHSKKIPPVCSEAFDVLKQRENDEYRRLLYVALTRAENYLYIGGYANKDKVPEDSWYGYVQNAFERLSDVEIIPFDKKNSDKVIYRYSNPALEDSHEKPDEEVTRFDGNILTAPDWLFTPMPVEPSPPRPLVPSRPSGQEDSALSPLKATDNYRFKRGNITHKLLQILPDIPADDWEKTIEKFLSQPAYGLSQGMQDSVLKEVLAVLHNDEFAPIFGENSMAEVPLTGLVNENVLVSGQIDRLLVTDKEIFVIDYKTNRPPPKRVEDVPKIYKNQMQSYADILKIIYPNRMIRTALLWTDGCYLTEINTQT